jgi:hypothetical protein
MILIQEFLYKETSEIESIYKVVNSTAKGRGKGRIHDIGLEKTCSERKLYLGRHRTSFSPC